MGECSRSVVELCDKPFPLCAGLLNFPAQKKRRPHPKKLQRRSAEYLGCGDVGLRTEALKFPQRQLVWKGSAKVQ